MTIVRTPKFASGGITPEERAQMDDIARLWMARAMRTDPIEPDKIVPAIHALYGAAGLKAPRVVVVPSPRIMALAGGIAAAWWHVGATFAATREAAYAATHAATEAATYAATEAATYAATREATEAATYAATREATEAATDAATREATEAATDAATFAATEAATYAATREATCAAAYAATHAATDEATHEATEAATEAATDEATEAATDAATFAATHEATEAAIKAVAQSFLGERWELALSCSRAWWRPYQGGNMWSPICAYIAAGRDVLGLRLPEHEKYAAWEAAAIHGGFRWMHEKFCIVSDFPEILRVDDQNRPHCENGPSHRWRDGWELYYWHGVRIPDEWIRDKTLTPEIALTWENAEQRRAACEIIGWEPLLKAMGAKLIDRDPEPTMGELYEVDHPAVGGRAKFLRMYCPTGRWFAEPVPPQMETALQANAWGWGLDAHEYFPSIQA